MKLVMSPNRWSCLPCCFAMIMNLELQDVIKWLAHDGSEIIFPNAPEPLRRRGFHEQELLDFSWNRGFSTTCFESSPGITWDGVEDYRIDNQALSAQRITYYLTYPNIIIIGVGENKIRHSVCWDSKSKHVFCPSRGIRKIEGFSIEKILILTRRVP